MTVNSGPENTTRAGICCLQTFQFLKCDDMNSLRPFHIGASVRSEYWQRVTSPYSYHNQHRQSVTHLRSFPSYSQRICHLPTSEETYSRQRPTFQLSANLQPVSNIQNNRTCCKIWTYCSLCLQWSSQSQPVCLLQASLN